MDELARCEGQEDSKLVSSLGHDVALLRSGSCARMVFYPGGLDCLLSWVMCVMREGHKFNSSVSHWKLCRL